jgi:ELWxxDGT repeat protein
VRRTAVLIVLVFTLAGSAVRPASALTPSLVRDIDPLPVPESSFPTEMVALGSLAVFSAVGTDVGREPWVSDGTAAGTFLLADACPGPCSGDPRDFVPTGDGRAFFLAGDALWVTRGTPVSTFRLTEAPVTFRPFGSLAGSVWAASRGRLYFAADDGVHGFELWTSDGTAAGTFQVADIRPGADGSTPTSLAVFQNKIFFNANGGSGFGLWGSDGTARGTRLVKGGASGPLSPRHLQPVGKVLVFQAFSSRSGLEIWRSDGAARGTVQLLDIEPGPASAGLGPFRVLGGRLLFGAGDSRRGFELWATDGTPGGTRPLTSFPGLGGGPVGEGTPVFPLGRRAVFLADDGVHGAEPWLTDGTPAGTRLVADVCPGVCSGVDTRFSERAVTAGNRVFLPLDDSLHGVELWSTDGTAAGTRLARDLCPGFCASAPFPFAAARGRVLFAALDGRNGPEVWASNGTPRGTVRVTDFDSPDPFADFIPAVALPTGTLFTAGDGAHGRELWRSDATAAGTELVADLATGDRGGSFPCTFRSTGSRLWFLADGGGPGLEPGYELWTSDGTPEGTRSVFDFAPLRPRCDPVLGVAEAGGKSFLLLPGRTASLALLVSDGTPEGTSSLIDGSLRITSDLHSIGSRVLFFADDAGPGTALWRSDGTVAGTVLVEDLVPGTSGTSSAEEPTVFNGRLFFTIDGGPEGEELWTSDGTAAGTFVVADLIPGPGPSRPTGLTVFRNRLHFWADTGSGGSTQLWSTDGTTAGTRLALDLSSFHRPIPAGDRMYLFASAPEGPSGLWITDGTPGGTRFLALVFPVSPLIGFPPVAAGGRLFFVSPDAVSQGMRLWTSDGTPEGTRPVVDHEGNEVLNPLTLRSFAGRLVFVVRSEDGEETLWQSDGTGPGTVPILPLPSPPEPPPGWPGPASDLVAAGERLFFPAWDPETGTELWALSPD